jgi:hypothetical protein
MVGNMFFLEYEVFWTLFSFTLFNLQAVSAYEVTFVFGTLDYS